MNTSTLTSKIAQAKSLINQLKSQQQDAERELIALLEDGTQNEVNRAQAKIEGSKREIARQESLITTLEGEIPKAQEAAKMAEERIHDLLEKRNNLLRNRSAENQQALEKFAAAAFAIADSFGIASQARELQRAIVSLAVEHAVPVPKSLPEFPRIDSSDASPLNTLIGGLRNIIVDLSMNGSANPEDVARIRVTAESVAPLIEA